MDERWWVNGETRRTVDVTDRGLTYGDGLFETIAVRECGPRFLDLHLARLLAGCARLGIPPPAGPALEQKLRAAAANATHAVLKVIVTRGSGPRGYVLPAAPRPTVIYGLLGTVPAAGENPAIRVRLCRGIASRNPMTAGLKTLGRLDQVLARAEWTDPAIGEGLMCDEDGNLVGGTASNVFMLLAGHLRTPVLARCGVHGIMRRVVMEQASVLGIPVSESALAVSELGRASEIFMTNALAGIRPVVGIDGRAYGVGPVTRRLRAHLAGLGVGECAEYC